MSCLERTVGAGFMEEVIAQSLEKPVRFTEVGCPWVGHTNTSLSYVVQKLVHLSLQPSLVPMSWRQVPTFPVSYVG